MEQIHHYLTKYIYMFNIMQSIWIYKKRYYIYINLSRGYVVAVIIGNTLTDIQVFLSSMVRALYYQRKVTINYDFQNYQTYWVEISLSWRRHPLKTDFATMHANIYYKICYSINVFNTITKLCLSHKSQLWEAIKPVAFRLNSRTG